jgi:hypothetical protein
MPINQISTSNTFAQWLVATQGLIENQNFVEDSANTIIDTANSIVIFVNNSTNLINSIIETANNDFQNVYNNTVIVFNNTEDVYDNTVIVYNDTVNVFIDIQNYVSIAFDTANTVNLIATEANTTATLALITANAALEASNTFFEEIFNLQDETSNTNLFYPTITASTIGVPDDVFVSSTKLNFRPSTGNLFSIISSSQNVITNNVVTGTINASERITSSNVVTNNVVTVTLNASGVITSSNVVTNNVVTGTVTASGLIQAQDFNSTSDITLKENIVQIDNPLNILENLTGIKFNWKNTQEVSYGLSAQEVEKILPDIVKTRESGLKGVNYLNIIAILIESVKELKKEIEDIKKHK